MAAIAMTMPTTGVLTPSSSRALLSTYQSTNSVTAIGIAASAPATILLRMWTWMRPMVVRLDDENSATARKLLAARERRRRPLSLTLSPLRGARGPDPCPYPACGRGQSRRLLAEGPDPDPSPSPACGRGSGKGLSRRLFAAPGQPGVDLGGLLGVRRQRAVAVARRDRQRARIGPIAARL